MLGCLFLCWPLASGGIALLGVPGSASLALSSFALHAASLPSFDNMTPGESFGASLWIAIFILKPTILGTIFLYEKYEKEAEEGTGPAWRRFDDPGNLDHEIAE